MLKSLGMDLKGKMQPWSLPLSLLLSGHEGSNFSLLGVSTMTCDLLTFGSEVTKPVLTDLGPKPCGPR